MAAGPSSSQSRGLGLRGTVEEGAQASSRGGLEAPGPNGPQDGVVIALARDATASETLAVPGAGGSDSAGAPSLRLRVAAAEAMGGRGAAGEAARDLTLTVDAVEAEGGTLYVAGAGEPGAIVRVYVDDIFVGEVETGARGRWLLEARHDLKLKEGTLTVRAEQVRAGSVRVEARAEAPFTRRLDAAALMPAAHGGSALAAVEGRPLAPPQAIIIRRGDTLWRLARRAYGRGLRYTTIYGANSDRIRNPDLIFPGQIFILPTRDRNWEARQGRRNEG